MRNDIINRFDGMKREVGFDLGGQLAEIFFIMKRNQHFRDPRTPGRQDFLSDSADR